MTTAHDEMHEDHSRRIRRSENEIVDIYDKLVEIDLKIDTKFAELDGRLTSGLEAVAARFDGVDARFDGVDARFDGVDARFDGLAQSVAEILRRLPDAS